MEFKKNMSLGCARCLSTADHCLKQMDDTSVRIDGKAMEQPMKECVT